ncbi:MAG: sigma-70 family RNA polymerase sigma factor [Clostridia bacterium]|nr:sigma-70 family RNA polymerase sigma factor [Clostridia bacterium]
MDKRITDAEIVELYFARSEQAIAESEKKYGLTCHRIAYNILHSDEDAEECVSDTWLKAWNAIPPERPGKLGAYLGTVTRRIALTRYEHRRAARRFAGVESSLEELTECIPENSLSVADEVVLKLAINGFLSSLPTRTRMIFMRKYWYMDSVADIAEAFGMTEGAVKVTLHRTRERFRKWLIKEGIYL